MRRVRGPSHARARHALLLLITLTLAAACSRPLSRSVFRDPAMDFGSIQVISVMPFQNLSRDTLAADRVRDVFINRLLSTGAVYVVPPGEVARAVSAAELQAPAAPSKDDVIKLAGVLKAQAVITGAVSEYGEVRSGSTSANLISVSVQMLEAQTGKVVWTASSTKGGITPLDRLLGGGGQPMNTVTRAAVDDLINKLFKQ